MSETQNSPPDLLVLHALRCLGFATVVRIHGVLGGLVEPDVDVEGELLRLASDGFVAHEPGAFAGWHLTEAGKEEDARRVAAELDALGRRAELRAAYDDFLPLNQRLLDVCSAWQVRHLDGVMAANHHRDPAYDGRVLDELARLDAEAQPVCDRLCTILSRFTHYAPRLGTALSRARRGEFGQVADDLDSYHTVWFQLHEDLLVTLGLRRSS